MSSFIVSARKYRPRSFQDVVGQDSITSTLTSAIQEGHLAQSFLFCGPRGVGKTTCARILAKIINCSNVSDDVNSCDACESCISFNKSNSFNIHELDAASNNSVEDIRNLIDQVRFAPQIGDYNIYIIDEVHMLSMSAFNAFLKTLEEPPDHAIFILATTEKHKIIPTILSRCQIFDFKNISVLKIIDRLRYISEKENITFEDRALDVIAHKSDGSLRDALSMFDRLLDASNLELTYERVRDNLNILDYEYYLRIMDFVLKKDVSSIMITIDEIVNNGFDLLEFINGLASHLRDLLVCKDPETLILFNESESVKELYLSQSKNFDLDFLIAALKICNETDIQYKSVKNPRLFIEMSILRLASIDSFKKKNNKLNIEFNSTKHLVKDMKNTDHSQDIKDNGSVLREQVIKQEVNNYHQEKNSSNLFSISNLMSSEEETVEKDVNNDLIEKIELNKIDEFQVLNQQNLIKFWNRFSDQKKLEGKQNLYITLRSSSPILKGEAIEMTIFNNAQIRLFDQYKSEILSSIRSEFNNDSLEIILVETEEAESKFLYTSKDKFNDMKNKNQNLHFLEEKLGLDPDY